MNSKAKKIYTTYTRSLIVYLSYHSVKMTILTVLAYY